jgi:alkylation response protein AidB-like acyl-CoA dehydrogenase
VQQFLPSWADGVADLATDVAGDADRCLRLAAEVGTRLPLPGAGATATRWALLALVAERDLTAGRVLEAHSDALAILAEAGEDMPSGRWGVFAAESATDRVDAVEEQSGTRLSGTKPWCSLAAALDHALVTAHTADGRRLYAVDLKDPTVCVGAADGWVARGLSAVPSMPVHFAQTPARAVGAVGWYLERPGFGWGGIGVAACWYGGARGLYRTLIEASSSRRGDINALHVGIVDANLHAAQVALVDAAARIDAGAACGAAGVRLALRVRAVVADAAERTLREVGHALGPAPLAFDETHARRVADLELYVRQHHGERDLAALGASVLDGAS